MCNWFFLVIKEIITAVPATYLSVSQVLKGFGSTRSMEVLPCKKNRSSAGSSFCCPSIIFVVSRKEKRSLSFSKRERHTFLYSKYVKQSFKFFKRSSKFLDSTACSMEASNRAMYQSREYWYIGSTDAKSAIQKNSWEDWKATGM